jgi:hypothetical protein
MAEETHEEKLASAQKELADIEGNIADALNEYAEAGSEFVSEWMGTMAKKLVSSDSTTFQRLTPQQKKVLKSKVSAIADDKVRLANGLRSSSFLPSAANKYQIRSDRSHYSSRIEDLLGVVMGQLGLPFRDLGFKEVNDWKAHNSIDSTMSYSVYSNMYPSPLKAKIDELNRLYGKASSLVDKIEWERKQIAERNAADEWNSL